MVGYMASQAMLMRSISSAKLYEQRYTGLLLTSTIIVVFAVAATRDAVLFLYHLVWGDANNAFWNCFNSHFIFVPVELLVILVLCLAVTVNDVSVLSCH